MTWQDRNPPPPAAELLHGPQHSPKVTEAAFGINQEFVNDQVGGRVLSAVTYDKMHAERRVEDARENVLDAALQVEEEVSIGEDVQQAVAELVTVVREYRAALEDH